MFDTEAPDNFMYLKFESASIDFGSINYRGLDRDDNTADLYSLRSKDKKKGHASKLMDYVCNIADMYNIELSLSAWADDFSSNPPDLLTQDELVSFYKRKGFVFDENICKGQRGVREPIVKPIEYNEQVDEFLKGLYEEYQEELMAVYID
jgi:hypothetical protein